MSQLVDKFRLSLHPPQKEPFPTGTLESISTVPECFELLSHSRHD